VRDVRLDESVRRLLDGKNFASVATLNPDGGPQSSVVWVLRDAEAVLFSTTSTRQKARNLTRDPRVSLTIFDAEDPPAEPDGVVRLIVSVKAEKITEFSP
jgi:PPOX class probable F420-dependent enzyme